MTEREVLLANAAQAIKEQRQNVEAEEEKRKQERMEPPEGTAPTGVEASR